MAELPTCQYTFLACAPLMQDDVAGGGETAADLEDERRIRIAVAVERRASPVTPIARSRSNRRPAACVVPPRSAAMVGRRHGQPGERVVCRGEIDLSLSRIASPRCCAPVTTHGPLIVFPGLMLTLRDDAPDRRT